MSYRLRLDDPPADGVRAVAVERLARASQRLREDHADDPVSAVHGARKDLKKTRAALRLVRPCLSRGVYRHESTQLRDLGRSMSGIRNADVMLETIEALADRFVGQLPKEQFTALERHIAAQTRDQIRAEHLAPALTSAAERAAAWPLEDCSDRALCAGAKRAYRRGRKAFAAAERDPSAERLHEWRKRVKDLWYHQRLLRDTWPGPVKAVAGECDRLGELLGDDHDLAMLADQLSGPAAETTPPAVDVDRILELIGMRRAELQAEAITIGRRLYAEKPKAFARRLARYLSAARADQGHPQPA